MIRSYSYLLMITSFLVCNWNAFQVVNLSYVWDEQRSPWSIYWYRRTKSFGPARDQERALFPTMTGTSAGQF